MTGHIHNGWIVKYLVDGRQSYGITIGDGSAPGREKAFDPSPTTE